MGYSVKWVADNLGITRDMLRYYEKEKLLPANENRHYRNYSDEDIERIWGIKLLIGIGFTAKEIYALMNMPDFDFDTAIAKKVKELERKHEEDVIYLEFAKSIKFLGRIPTTSKIGSVKFDDFLAYAHENWNFYDDPRSAPFMQIADTLISKEPQEWSPDDVEVIIRLSRICKNSAMTTMQYNKLFACCINIWLSIIRNQNLMVKLLRNLLRNIPYLFSLAVM